MSHESGEKIPATERAVAQLRAYARYIDEHAENIVGDIDRPNFITEDGINISFNLVDADSLPNLTVTKEHLVVDAVLGDTDATWARRGDAGTCKDVCASVSEFTCSACGFSCDLTSWISLFDGDDGRHRHHHYGTPNYCPNCGAEVVDE